MNVADSAPPLAKWVNHPYAIDRSANVPVRGTEPVMDERHAAMTRAYELAAAFPAPRHDRAVGRRAAYQEMLGALGGELPAAGLDPVDVVGDLARLADPGIAGTAGGRVFGFGIGGG